MSFVRPARVADAAPIRALSEALGYRRREAEVAAALDRLSADPSHAIRVVEVDGLVVGFLHARRSPSVLRDEAVEIASLVVDERFRGRGLGGQLLAAAERWAGELGIAEIRLASQTHREPAHRFYERLGYRRLKTSHFFGKGTERGPLSNS